MQGCGVVRAFLLVFSLLIGISTVQAQQRTPEYLNSERVYKSTPIETRLLLQVLLIASGDWSAVPNLEYNSRLHQAIASSQIKNRANGGTNDNWINNLVGSTKPIFSIADFQQVRHPTKDVTILVPRGLAPNQTYSKNGLKFQSKLMQLSFSYYDLDLETAYYKLLELSGNVEFKLLRKDFFVVISTDNGSRTYTRYHRHDGGMIGFDYTRSSGDWRSDVIQTLISGSLYINKAYGLILPLPNSESTNSNQNVARAPAAPIAPSAVASPPPLPTPPASTSSSGSGFFVSSNGHIVTNAHVVDGCQNITISKNGEPQVQARLGATDPQNDLAILIATAKPEKILNIRMSPAKLGEPIAAFGFPLSNVLSRNGNFTLGNVTALAGINDDSRELQVSAAVQPGNSGGPLLDYNGDLVGVVASKLNAMKTASRVGDIPQNVNFAIKATNLASFLDANRVAYSTNIGSTMQVVELAEHARLATVFISCQK